MGRDRDMDIGISGIAVYAPPFKVSLERWCEWTGNPWDKVSAVVGKSFRQPGPHESICAAHHKHSIITVKLIL